MDETQNGTEDFDDETETNESTSDVLAVLGAGAVIGAVATKGYSKAKDAVKARVAAVKEKRDAKENAIETTAKEKKEK